MKRRLAVVLTLVCSVALALAGCQPDGPGNNPDRDVSLSEYGLSEKDVMKRCDAKYEGGGIYFRIVEDVRVYAPDSPVKYVVYAALPVEQPLSVRISFTNKAFKVEESVVHTLPASGQSRARAGSFTASKNGVYSVGFAVANESGSILYTTSKNIGVMPKANAAASSKDFYFGVQPFLARVLEWGGLTAFTGMNANETYDLTWKYIDYIGANLIRDGVVWSPQQLSADSAPVFDNNDRVVADSEKRGITLDWMLGGTPDWAVRERDRDQPVKWNRPPTVEAWTDYVTACASRYSDKTHIIYEIINECNWFDFLVASPEEYLELLDIAVEVVGRESGASRVIPGGMVTPIGSYTADVERETYYKRYGELINSGKIEMVPYHNHWGYNQFTNEVKVYRDALAANGIGKRYAFLNEAGLELGGPAQSYEVLKKAHFAYGNDHAGFVMFSFRATPDAGEDALPSWGAITENNEPKELYISYGHFIRQMDGAKLVKRYANDAYGMYLYEKDGSHFLVQYRSDSAPAAQIRYPEGARYTVYDQFGNETDRALAESFGVSPVYVQFEGNVDPDAISLKVGAVWSDRVDFGW